MSIFKRQVTEATTEKVAGYNAVWEAFVDGVYNSDDLENDLQDLLYQANEAYAGEDGETQFSLGKKAAFEKILTMPDDEFNWFLEVKVASDSIKNGEDKSDVLVMMKEASLASTSDVAKADDLRALMLRGKEETSQFEFGKYAALCDLSNLESLEECIEATQNALNADFEKVASEEEAQYRMGVESVCFEFMKIANDVFAFHGDSEDAFDIIMSEIQSANSNVIEKLAEQPAIFDGDQGPPNMPRQVEGFVHNEGRVPLDKQTADAVNVPDHKEKKNPGYFNGIGNWKKNSSDSGMNETSVGGGAYALSKGASLTNEAVAEAISILEDLDLC